MPSTLELLRARREKIVTLAAGRGASHIRLFGPVAREEDAPGSGIEFLVTLAPERSILDLGGLSVELGELLERECHVTEDKAVRPEQRRILEEAVIL